MPELFRRSCLLAATLVLLSALAAGAARASNNNDGENDGGSGGRDSQDSWLADEIKLELFQSEVERVIHLYVTKLAPRKGPVQESLAEMLEELRNSPPRQVLIDSRIVEVTDVNKLNLSDIPLLGGLVGPEFDGDDMTEENKVGNVYSNGSDGLFIVLEPTALGDPGQLNISRLIVFNDDYSHEVKPLKLDFAPSREEIDQVLGTLAPLPSVRSVTTEVAIPDGGTVLLGGLRQEDHRNDESQVPFLGDIPVLNGLFRGTAHQDGRSNLLILIKPSVVKPGED